MQLTYNYLSGDFSALIDTSKGHISTKFNPQLLTTT